MSPKALWYCMDYACKSDLAASKLGLKVPETLGKKEKGCCESQLVRGPPAENKFETLL